MINLNIEEKIKKCIKFIKKKFDKAVIEVKIVNEESLYIELTGDGYIISDKYDGKCNGILIIQDGENNFYEFKEILRDIPEYFEGNGIVFLRYEISTCDVPQYIQEQFINYFKLNKYRDIEEYTILSKDDDISGIFISAQYHVELLDNDMEYEDYEPNFFVNKNRCQGRCCSSGDCEKCEKKCCKK